MTLYAQNLVYTGTECTTGSISSPGQGTIKTRYCFATYGLSTDLVAVGPNEHGDVFAGGGTNVLLDKIGLCNTIASGMTTAGYLGNVAVGVYANTMNAGLLDVRRFFRTGVHITSSLGGMIAWQNVKIDWTPYRGASSESDPNLQNGGAADIFRAFVADMETNGTGAAGLVPCACPQNQTL